jgi:hypothetical protein
MADEHGKMPDIMFYLEEGEGVIFHLADRG